jgi:hypothetical protein
MGYQMIDDCCGQNCYTKGNGCELDELLIRFDRLKSTIDSRLNDYLCEMKPNYDDSITGFNEAWDIVRKVFEETK